MCTAYRLNWYVVLCVMTAFLASSVGELTRVCYPEDLEKRGAHLCGKQLANALAEICRHGYHNQKRSAVSPVAQAPAVVDSWEVEPVGQGGKSPFIEKRLAVSMLNKRGKRGIVCECCKHRCNLFELWEYCKRPGKRVPSNARPSENTGAEDLPWALIDAEDREDPKGGDQASFLQPEGRADTEQKTEGRGGHLVGLLLEKSSLYDVTNE